MTEDRAEYDTNRRLVPEPEGVEHIGDIIRQLIDDREWQDALTARVRSNGHSTALPRGRRHDDE